MPTMLLLTLQLPLLEARRLGLGSLLSIRDAFTKALIARTRRGPYTREGVLVLDLAR